MPLREPLLSVVLPVYNVREYLPVCLDSLLGVPGVGGRLEVVAVDDCSPDGCGELLDEVAERDGRLRVLHLAENVGLGGARQAGLEVAEGRFVWFVDSDDWLPEGALVAVLGALEATDPQVLLFDYESVFPDGRREGDRWRAALSSPAKPAVFAAVEHPEVLRLVMTAWSRVLRRDYLVGLGVRFGPGFYEDISVTYPSLVAAERVSVLDRVCYCYRRGRVGAITATSSSRHAEVFAQYARIFAFLDGHPGCEPFRAAVFGRTVRHAATLLELPGLVPAGQRRAFFAAISEHARVRRPAGWRPGGGVWGVRERLILGGRYRVYAVLVAGIRARREARAVVRGVVREGGVLRRKARAAVGVARYRVIAGTRGVDERLAVFAAYWYRGYACNPAAIYEAAREGAPWLRGVWVVERGREHTLPEGVPYVVAGSGAYLRLMATAKYLVNNVNFPHDVPKRAGQVEVQTQHGTPLKTVGEDLRAFPRGAAGMNFARLREHVARWDYLVSPSPYASRVWERAYPGRYELLEVGYPRDDVLAVADARRVAAARAALGVPEGVIVVLYAPTHREQHEGFVPLLDVPGLARALGEKYVVLVRAHYFYADQGVSVGGGVDAVARAGGGVARVIDVTGHPRVEELSLAADVLVSDYSSLLTDYAVLDRPMVLHVPDWEVYRRVRGVYVDLVREPPGVVTTSLAELVAAFTSGAVFGPEAAAARAAFRARFCPHEDGRAAERVVRAVFTPPAGGGWG